MPAAELSGPQAQDQPTNPRSLKYGYGFLDETVWNTVIHVPVSFIVYVVASLIDLLLLPLRVAVELLSCIWECTRGRILRDPYVWPISRAWVQGQRKPEAEVGGPHVELVDVGGRPTEVLVARSAKTSRSRRVDPVHVIVIPGNPGAPQFYADFTRRLWLLCGEAVHVHCIGYVGHTSASCIAEDLADADETAASCMAAMGLDRHPPADALHGEGVSSEASQAMYGMDADEPPSGGSGKGSTSTTTVGGSVAAALLTPLRAVFGSSSGQQTPGQSPSMDTPDQGKGGSKAYGKTGGRLRSSIVGWKSWLAERVLRPAVRVAMRVAYRVGASTGMIRNGFDGETGLQSWLPFLSRGRRGVGPDKAVAGTSEPLCARLDLKAQIRHKVLYLRQLLRAEPRARLVLCGHSIGAHMAQECARAVGDESVGRVVGLYPTVEHIGETPNGVRLFPTMTWYRQAHGCAASLLSIVPPMLLDALALFYLKQAGYADPSAEGMAAMRALLHRRVPQNALTLAWHEMKELQGMDASRYAAFEDRTLMFMGVGDQWNRPKEPEILMQALPKAQVLIDPVGHGHAFCMGQSASWDVAQRIHEHLAAEGELPCPPSPKTRSPGGSAPGPNSKGSAAARSEIRSGSPPMMGSFTPKVPGVPGGDGFGSPTARLAFGEDQSRGRGGGRDGSGGGASGPARRGSAVQRGGHGRRGSATGRTGRQTQSRRGVSVDSDSGTTSSGSPAMDDEDEAVESLNIRRAANHRRRRRGKGADGERKQEAALQSPTTSATEDEDRARGTAAATGPKSRSRQSYRRASTGRRGSGGASGTTDPARRERLKGMERKVAMELEALKAMRRSQADKWDRQADGIRRVAAGGAGAGAESSKSSAGTGAGAADGLAALQAEVMAYAARERKRRGSLDMHELDRAKARASQERERGALRGDGSSRDGGSRGGDGAGGSARRRRHRG